MNMLNKRHKYFISFVLICAGILFGAYGVAKSKTSERPVNLAQIERGLTERCENILRRSDFDFQPTRDGFEMTLDGIGQYQGKLFQSALVVTSCEGFDMTSMCMGLSCPDVGSSGGIWVELTLEDIEGRLR